MTGPEWWTLVDRPESGIWGSEGVLAQKFFGIFLEPIFCRIGGSVAVIDACDRKTLDRAEKSSSATRQSTHRGARHRPNDPRKPLQTKGLRRHAGMSRRNCRRT